MFVTVFSFGRNVQVFPYESKEEAIKAVHVCFDRLIKDKEFEPDQDGAIVYEKLEYGKEMVPVYISNEDEKYLEENFM